MKVELDFSIPQWMKDKYLVYIIKTYKILTPLLHPQPLRK